ncbi:MAG: hypothetical protein ACTSPV_09800 [Candidatus Hodarchaeales archaeon]
MQKIRIILILLFLILFLPANHVTYSEASIQWGWPSHHLIAEKAVENLDSEWQTLFESLIATVKGGSILPDTWHDLGDTPNHLYYPENPSGTTGPQAIHRWFDFYVGNLSIGNYKDAVFAGAIMSHYWADLNIPVHTDEYWPGHSAFESDINAHLSEFTLGAITVDTNIPDIEQYAIDAATYAHQYYDVIRDAYPDGTQNDEVVTNATIKVIVEEQLTRAISGLASLWMKGIGDDLAPIVQVTTSQKALIDNHHINDYEDSGDLANLISYLKSLGFEVIEWNETITEEALSDVDFLVVTAFETDYTTSELTAISNWINSGQRSVFVTGRGDYTSSITHTGINALLSEIGTVIRMNDDNIYTVSSDPHYYKDWYIYSENVQAPEGKSFLDVAEVFHLFSPNSLYFDGSSASLQVLVNGTQYHYQADESTPPIDVVWDNTNDGVGGEVIPLVASEILSSGDNEDRIIVFGDTSFSDFAFAPSSFHDNEHFLPVLIEWVLFDEVAGGYHYLPRVEIASMTTTVSSPVTINYKVSNNTVEVDLLQDGTVVETDSQKPFDAFTFDIESGTHNITVVAKNSLGEFSTDTVIIDITSSTTGESTTTTTTTTEPTTEGKKTPSPWNIFLISITISMFVYFRRKYKG